MKRKNTLLLAAGLLAAAPLRAEVGRADYERALSLRDRYQNASTGVADAATWLRGKDRFFYRRSVKGGHEFVMVDADTQQKRPAFDHERLAAALAKATGERQDPLRIPSNGLRIADDE